MKVIGVTGMPGSGKGIVAGVARNLGFQVIRMGDIIREEAQRRDADIGETAIKLRKEYGEFVVAERCIEKIKTFKQSKKDSLPHKNNDDSKTDGESRDNSKSGDDPKDQPLIIIEGIRSPFEVKLFKKHFHNFKVISVNSTPETRFKRLINRKRADDSNLRSDFVQRDIRELKFGVGEVIATADYMVVNEGSIKRLKSIIRSILGNEMRNEG